MFYQQWYIDLKHEHKQLSAIETVISTEKYYKSMLDVADRQEDKMDKGSSKGNRCNMMHKSAKPKMGRSLAQNRRDGQKDWRYGDEKILRHYGDMRL